MWVGSILVHACGYRVGIRTDDRDLLARLRSKFRVQMVDATGPTDDFSLRIGRVRNGFNRLQPQLLNGRCTVLRSRSVDRLVHRLDLALALLDVASLPGLIRVHGLAAVTKAGNAVLVPRTVVYHSSATERAITGVGGRIAEDVATYLDTTSGEVVVVGGLSQNVAPAMTDDGITALPGRYALRALFWSAEEMEDGERRSVGVVRMMRRLVDLSDLEPQHVLDGVTAMSSRFAPTGLRPHAADLSKALSALS